MEHNGYIGFRITHSQFKVQDHPSFWILFEYYKQNIEKYLETIGYVIISHVAGQHLEAEAPHIHIHYLVNTGTSRIPKVFCQDWKYKFEHNLAPVIPQEKHDDVTINYPSLYKYKHKKKINISIQFTPKDGVEPFDRFLAYPLKEGHLLSHSLEDTEIVTLLAQAQGEWNVAKIKSYKIKQKKDRSDSEYGKICEIIATGKPESYVDALRLVLEEIKSSRVEFRQHVNPRFLIQSVQKYCYHVGIWTVDDIIQKFA
ncbi:MAG: putative replicase [Cressdnaviricota sp.]|nr:MAG: putative replicase [Cressdnaviricota sp.]